MSDQDKNQSASKITRPLSESDMPPTQDPALPTSTSSAKEPLRTQIWNRLKEESNALEALSALLAMIAIGYGVLSYVGEEPQRRQAAHNTAWQVINSATGQKVSGGRIEALQELNKDHVSLDGLAASNANLLRIKLPNAHLSDADLQQADLQQADLHRAILRGANLQGAVLAYTNLQGAFLQNANLQGAYLFNANLQSAYLGYAELQGAYLQSADLQNANLESSNLQGAGLQHADLTDADLTDADLTNADFRDSENLTSSQVRLAKNWDNALFDTSLKEELGLSP